MPNARVAVIDDDRMVREMLELGLSREGYEVRTATDGLAALELVKVFDPEFIVLDIMMPKIDGITLLPRLREITQAPILMLTAKGGTDDKVRSLSSGADDYLGQAVRLRRADRAPSGQAAAAAADRRERFRWRDVCDQSRHARSMARARTLWNSRSASSILLEVFMREPRRVFSKDHLLEIVWGHDFEGGPNIVETYISYLRARSTAPASRARSFARFEASVTASPNKLGGPRVKLASRLSALYAALLGVTVLIVILASSIALVASYGGFTRDVMVAKHEEARIWPTSTIAKGMSLAQGGPEIVAALSGIGLRVTVFDLKGPVSRRRQDLASQGARPHLALGGHRTLYRPATAAVSVRRRVNRRPIPRGSTDAARPGRRAATSPSRLACAAARLAGSVLAHRAGDRDRRDAALVVRRAGCLPRRRSSRSTRSAVRCCAWPTATIRSAASSCRAATKSPRSPRRITTPPPASRRRWTTAARRRPHAAVRRRRLARTAHAADRHRRLYRRTAARGDRRAEDRAPDSLDDVA